MNNSNDTALRYMKLFSFIAVFLLCLVTAHNVQAESENKPFIAIQELTTKSGIDVWFVEDTTVPVLSIKFFFEHVGAAYESAEKQGLARLVSNTLDEGAGEYDAKAFQKALTDHSISLSFSSSRDHFSGKLKTLTRYQDKAFSLLKLALSEPRFDEDAVERMRAANIARIRASLSKPNWINARLFNDVLYGDHPYAQNSGGTLTTLSALTPDDLRSYVEENLTRDRLKVAVTGDIAAEELLKAIDSIFEDLPKTRDSDRQKVSAFNWPEEGHSALFTMPLLPQSSIMLAFPSLRMDDEHYYAMKLLSTVLGGSGFGSRLMEEIREKHGLTYGIYSYLSENVAASMLQINASSQNETVTELLNRTMGELKRLQDEPLSLEELNSHRNYVIGSMPLSLTSTDKISSIIQFLQMNDLPSDYLDTRTASLNAVTPETIQQLAKNHFKPENAVVIVTGGIEAEVLNSELDALRSFTPKTTLPNVE